MRVVATAGHVDHGKSTLVRALTGMEPDRFAEERRRGMTIDLGYAWTTLPSGEAIEFVDVPGHERFIANMLSGLGPAPAVLFVVAADEGWSRQSEEHLAAIDALEVRHGLLAVTRSDLADPAPARDEALARLAGSSLGTVASVCTSGVTGAGLDDLRAGLDRMVHAVPVPPSDERVRLWLDRSFTVRGSGTVVTGTLAAGSIAVGDVLQLYGRTVAVRHLQTMNESREHVAAAARVALNLRGVDREQIGRGDVLVTPDAWHWTATIDVQLSTDEQLPQELVLHIGTAAEAVHVRPLAGNFARLTTARQLPWQSGDRAVLRDPGRHSVVAGVLVIDADPPALDRRGAAARRAAYLRDGSGSPLTAQAEVQRRGAVERSHLAKLGIPLDDLGEVVRIGELLIAADTWRRWVETAPAVVAQWSARSPIDPAMPLAALRQALQLPAGELLPPLLGDAGLRMRDGRVVPTVASSELGAAEAAVRTVEQRLLAAPFSAPESDELTTLGLRRRELAAAERTGRLLNIAPGIVLLPSAPERALSLLGALAQPFTSSQARQALGTTRRVAIPLLEYLDALGRTERVDSSSRRVRPRSRPPGKSLSGSS